MNAVILLGHGSRLESSKSDLQRVASALAKRTEGLRVCVAYQEICEPTLEQVAEQLVTEGASRVAILPYFLHLGRHVKTQIPELLQVLRNNFPNVEWLLGEHLSYDPRLVDILCERVMAFGLCNAWRAVPGVEPEDHGTPARTLPLALRVTGRTCVVVGAGAVGWRKAQTLAQAGASLRIIARDFLPSREHWTALGATLCEGPFDGFSDGPRPFLVVAATDDVVENARIAREARALGALVCRVDDPNDSDFVFSATVRRGKVTVSFSTDGLVPRLSGYLKRIAERAYDSSYAAMAEVLSRIGAAPATRALSSAARRAWLSDERLAALHRQVTEVGPDAAFATLSEELKAGTSPEADRARSGLVSLVGAGPGDPELLTLRGAQRLAEADVVVHDDLVSVELMDRHAPGARRIDVGKRKGTAYLKQEEINGLLVELGRAGNRVVRLKGGDPCLFGRAEEERQALESAGLRCEIVSGVSSLSAVPAAAGIIVTNRYSARSIGAFSLHKRDGTHPLGSEWQQMANGPDTLVLFMGRTILREACEQLIRAGRARETPAALVINGTLPNQCVVRGTLGSLPDEAASQSTKGPGLIVVGEACLGGD